MAFLDSILGVSKVTDIGETGGDPIVLDASVREVHSVAGELSDHPVEVGIDIVDNYRVLPRVLQIEGLVTDTPLSTEFPGASLINSAIGVIEGDVAPSVNAWQEFQRFFDEAVVLTINTRLKRYTNMVLIALDVTRDANTANGLTFTASAREILFVDTEEGTALTLPVSPTGQKTKSAGKATNTNANGAEASESSGLVKIGQGLGIIN